MAYQDAVVQMGKWYESNIHAYGAQYFNCNLLGGKVRSDCSGYVSACMRLAGIFTTDYTSGQFLTNGAAGKLLARAGFVPMSWRGYDGCQPYDILAKDGHVEIYGGKQSGAAVSWGWGSRHDTDYGKSMPWWSMKNPTYQVVWRLNGVASDYQPDYSNPATYGASMSSGPTNYVISNNFENRSSIFSSADINTMSITLNGKMNVDDTAEHTRIYAAGTRTLMVDELSMSIDGDIYIGDRQKSFSEEMS